MQHFVEEMHQTNKDPDGAADQVYWHRLACDQSVIFPFRTFSFEGNLEAIIYKKTRKNQKKKKN